VSKQYLVLAAILIVLAMVGCASPPSPTFVLYPQNPMFTLTPFEPTATPAARPIPPLSDPDAIATPQPLPYWLEALSPQALGSVSLADFRGVCIKPRSEWMENYPAILDLFWAGERARDHLYLEVNGVIPSELTWQHIIVPNSTDPGTAWFGVRTYRELCWPTDLTIGLYEARLHYPTETGSATYVWYFQVQ
jgi:hypothetical protein